VTDALAALGTWPIEVELGGRTWTIPATPAAGWFIAILREDPLPIIPGMLGEEEQLDIVEALAFGLIDVDDITQASRDALEVASGWRWWAADRMIRSAGAEWKIVSGQLIRRGIDLEKLPLGAVLNALYAMSVEGLEGNKRTQFDFDLNRPPAGAMSEEEREEEAAAMMQAAMQEAGRGGS
jgi:hypothetical protein